MPKKKKKRNLYFAVEHLQAENLEDRKILYEEEVNKLMEEMDKCGVPLIRNRRTLSIIHHLRGFDRRWGGVGGHWRSPQMVMAHPLAEEVADTLGIDPTVAFELLCAVGVSIQRRLLSGKPSGIPYLGVVGLNTMKRSPKWVEEKIASVDRYIVKLKARAKMLERKRMTVDMARSIRRLHGFQVHAQNLRDGLHDVKHTVTLTIPRSLKAYYDVTAQHDSTKLDMESHIREEYMRQRAIDMGSRDERDRFNIPPAFRKDIPWPLKKLLARKWMCDPNETTSAEAARHALEWYMHECLPRENANKYERFQDAELQFDLESHNDCADPKPSAQASGRGQQRSRGE